MDVAIPTLGMQEFLVESRDAFLSNSLHKDQDLMGNSKVIEWAQGAGGGEYPTTTRRLN